MLPTHEGLLCILKKTLCSGEFVVRRVSNVVWEKAFLPLALSALI